MRGRGGRAEPVVAISSIGRCNRCAHAEAGRERRAIRESENRLRCGRGGINRHLRRSPRSRSSAAAAQLLAGGAAAARAGPCRPACAAEIARSRAGSSAPAARRGRRPAASQTSSVLAPPRETRRAGRARARRISFRSRTRRSPAWVRRGNTANNSATHSQAWPRPRTGCWFAPAPAPSRPSAARGMRTGTRTPRRDEPPAPERGDCPVALGASSSPIRLACACTSASSRSRGVAAAASGVEDRPLHRPARFASAPPRLVTWPSCPSSPRSTSDTMLTRMASSTPPRRQAAAYGSSSNLCSDSGLIREAPQPARAQEHQQPEAGIEQQELRAARIEHIHGSWLLRAARRSGARAHQRQQRITRCLSVIVCADRALDRVATASTNAGPIAARGARALHVPSGRGSLQPRPRCARAQAPANRRARGRSAPLAGSALRSRSRRRSVRFRSSWRARVRSAPGSAAGARRAPAVKDTVARRDVCELHRERLHDLGQLRLQHEHDLQIDRGAHRAQRLSQGSSSARCHSRRTSSRLTSEPDAAAPRPRSRTAARKRGARPVPSGARDELGNARRARWVDRFHPSPILRRRER